MPTTAAAPSCARGDAQRARARARSRSTAAEQQPGDDEAHTHAQQRRDAVGDDHTDRQVGGAPDQVDAEQRDAGPPPVSGRRVARVRVGLRGSDGRRRVMG